MIVTVPPNPSIDRTIHIDRLERGALIRADAATSEAAGKGLNVARALKGQGVETLAVLPMARESAATYLALLDGAVGVEPVPVAGSVRVNISLVEPDGTVTKVNEPGPPLTEAEVEAILGAVAAAPPASWIVGCGSLPPGAPADFYARLRGLAADVPDRRVAVDSSGDALFAAVLGGVSLVKPNLAELEAMADRSLPTIGAAIDAATELVGRGAGAVLVSLGPDGALYLDGDGAIAHAEAEIEDVVNTVGAGDALLAGFLASGADAAALPEAIAWSVAAVRSPGTRMRRVAAEDRQAVAVHDVVDRGRRLRP